MSSKAHNFEYRSRTKDVLIDEQLNFNALLLREETLNGLHNSGFRVPSPIQVKAIPIGKCGFDLIIKAKSGTGKTVVFSVITLELVNVTKSNVQALILSPTREVAVQICDVLKTVGSEFKDLKVQSFIGGFPVDEDIKKLGKCHIAVGAPGRIKHLLHLGALKPDKIKLFILDEADKLINSEMRNDIDYISKKLPATKQVIASSATYCNEVIAYLNSIMSRPTFVEPNTETPLLLGLKQFVTVVKSNLNVVHQLNIKNEELIKLLSQVTFSQCLVFTNYQSRAESISNTLNRKGWNSMHISAAQNQGERLTVINSFKEGKCRILLSTDITARGIDAANVDLVINYDVPYEASTYLHRMGRAGRFGSHGICITIAAVGKDLDEYCKILGTIGGTNLFVLQLPNDGNLPSDLWNADSSCFKLIHGILDDSIKFTSKAKIVNYITDLKVQRDTLKQTKSEASGKMTDRDDVNEHSISEIDEANSFRQESVEIDEKIETLKENADSDMANVIETKLNNNKAKEENFKSKVTSSDPLSLLKDLATGKNICQVENKISEVETISLEHLSDDTLSDITNSKKRKRTPENMPCINEISNEVVQDMQIGVKQNPKQIMCKNLALLNATKLLCESYGTDPISKDIVSALQSYLETIREDKYKIFLAHSKENILNLIVNGGIESLLNGLLTTQKEDVAFENNANGSNRGLENIFKLSYDYAVNSRERHWLDVIGEELLEKVSLTDKVPEDDPQSSFSEVDTSILELPKRRKHKSYKKKTFKDFTQRSKKNKNDPANDQTMETYDDKEVNETTNQIEPNYYYQAGLYSDYEYANNEQFTSCFNHYSEELTQKLHTFEDVQNFDTWFAEWQWQIQGVRDYIQQNIYLQEMNKYAYSKQS